MKKALVCGAGGFIGGHLVKKLKHEGYWVRGVDIKPHEFARRGRRIPAARSARRGQLPPGADRRRAATFDEVYQLAADMGGMGFIHSAECEIMHNSVLINIHMTDAAARMGVPRYFFSSSVCVYRDMKHGEPEMTEAEAIPAHPDNEYGWEKLYSERMAQAYEPPLRHAGPHRALPELLRPRRHVDRRPRESARRRCAARWPKSAATAAPSKCGATAAPCAPTPTSDDMVDGIYRLMHSDLEGAVNIGCPQYVTVDELAQHRGARSPARRSPSSTCRGRWACSRATSATSASTRWAGRPRSSSKTASA